MLAPAITAVAATRGRRAGCAQPPSPPAAAPPPRPSEPSTAGLSPRRRDDRQSQCKHLPLAAQVLQVGSAPGARLEVVPEPAPPQATPAGGRPARCGSLEHGASRASWRSIRPALARKTEPLHVLHLAPEHVGDLGVGQVVQLGEHQCGTLVVRQVMEVAEQLLQVGALSYIVVQPRGGKLARPGPAARAGRAASTGSGCAPPCRAKPEMKGPVALVSSRWAATNTCCTASSASSAGGRAYAGKAEHAGQVALVEHLESALIPLPRARDEIVITPQAQERPRGARRHGSSRRRDGGAFHCLTVCTQTPVGGQVRVKLTNFCP